MDKFFDYIIDLWLEKINNKMRLAYETESTLPTVYRVINKERYNLTIIQQMWLDIRPYLKDDERLQIIVLLDLI